MEQRERQHPNRGPSRYTIPEGGIMTEVTGIVNTYGGLHLLDYDGRYFWAIGDYDGFYWDEIPKSLYDEIIQFEKTKAPNE